MNDFYIFEALFFTKERRKQGRAGQREGGRKEGREGGKKEYVTETVRSSQSPKYLLSSPLQKKFMLPWESKAHEKMSICKTSAFHAINMV